MFPRMVRLSVLFSGLFSFLFSFAPAADGRITFKNDLGVARLNESMVLTRNNLEKILPVTDLKKIHIKDSFDDREVLCQAIDLNGDTVAEELIFQADFRPMESKTFIAFIGEKQTITAGQFKAYGRFARERFDDFAWENDRVAFRMYGLALETWVKEPLTSSAVDVWCKRVRKLVINDWYMVDNYHTDTGEGADFYSAGKSRGCGGSGIWKGGQLYVSRNFQQSKVIANGPIRVIFELTYAPWNVDGENISEVKRITLDAGSHLNHFESYYQRSQPETITFAAGIKNNKGSSVLSQKEAGWMRTWEPLPNNNGQLGCGIVIEPDRIVEFAASAGDYLVVAKTKDSQTASYYAGFSWDKSGDFPSAKEWESYLEHFSQRLRSPLKSSTAIK